MARRAVRLIGGMLAAVSLFGPAAAPAADVTVGDVLVADSGALVGSSAVLAVDAASGRLTVLATAGLLRDPMDVVQLPDGRLLVTDAEAFGGPGGIVLVDPLDGSQTPLVSGAPFVDPAGMVRAPNGDLYVADRGAGKDSRGAIIRVRDGVVNVIEDGGSGDPSTFMLDPTGLVLDGDTLLVADPNAASGAGALLRIGLAVPGRTIVSSNPAAPGPDLFADPIGVALSEGEAKLPYLADLNAKGTGATLAVNPATGQQASVRSGAPFQSPDAVDNAPGGLLYVLDRDAEPNAGGSGGALFRLNPLAPDPVPVEVVTSNDRSVAAGGPAALGEPQGLTVATVTRKAPPPPPPPVPTPQPTPQPAPTPLPALKVSDTIRFPSTRRCVSRRAFTIRIRRPRGVTISEARVWVNGRRVQTRRGARVTAPVVLKGLPKGRFTVKIEVRAGDGRKVTGTRRYRTCARKRSPSGHIRL